MDLISTKDPIIICDIGASPIDKTNFVDILFEKSNCKLIGFEPNKNEFKKLTESPKKKYYNFAVGDGKEHILNICSAPGMSSLLKPNFNYLNLFHGFKEWSKIIEEVKIQTKKLDDLDIDFDFLKLDVQGFESEVIKNGKEKIKNSLVVNVETSPFPLYENEKTFSYVSSQLEELGFFLHMFEKINTRSFVPTLINNNPYLGLNHLFQLDCVFIKKLDKIEKMSVEKLKKLILIMLHSFNSFDLVSYLISKLDQKNNTNILPEFMKISREFKLQKKY